MRSSDVRRARQGQDGDALLRAKRQFADDAIAALKEPYVGILTSKGVEPGAELRLCAVS